MEKQCSFCKYNKKDIMLHSFPDSRKNPALYIKWCNTLNIDPKEEKVKKPLVCSLHFNPKHLSPSGNLKSLVVPWRKAKPTKNYKKTKKLKKYSPEKSKSTYKEAKVIVKDYVEERRRYENEMPEEDIEYEFVNEIEIKEEPFEEVTIEQSRFADQPTLLPQVEYLQSEIVPSETTSDTKSVETCQETCEKSTTESDEDFLESLLPDVMKMKRKQKETFYKLMKTHLVNH